MEPAQLPVCIVPLAYPATITLTAWETEHHFLVIIEVIMAGEQGENILVLASL